MRRFICGLLVGVLSLAFLSSCGNGEVTLTASADNVIAPKTANNDIKSNHYEPVYETDSLQLLFNRNTTHFNIINKANGKSYASKGSTPFSANENSLFDITFLDKKGVISSMSSYTDSVEKGQYKVEPLKDGVKITYTLGNVQEKLFCPSAVSKERFEAILDKISDSYDRMLLKSNYYVVDYENMEDAQKRAELAQKYPTLKDTVLYVIKQDVLPINVQRDIHRILTSIGYDDQENEMDAKNSSGTFGVQYPAFNVRVYITLNGDELDVRIPIGEIEEFNDGRLITLNLLRNFASPEKGQSGCFVLPDGSGSIMEFYSPKNDLQEYQVSVYGQDESIQQMESIYKQQQAYLPIFIKKFEDGAVFAEITDGDAIADIKATPGSDSSYAAAYPMFRVREVAKSYLNSATNENDFFYIAQKRLYDKDIACRYSFFETGNNSIADLADYYSNRLFGEKKTGGSIPPIYIEFVGSAKQESTLFGFKTHEKATFTTLKQVQEIAGELVGSGVQRLVLKLTGFFNGGLEDTVFQGVKLDKDVGSQKDLDELLAWCEKNAVEIYFDADVQYSTDSGLFDGFSKARDASYLITRVAGTKPEYNKSTFILEESESAPRYILHPESVVKALDQLEASARKRNISSLSLSNIGRQLNSDFKKGREFERQNSMKTIKAAVDKLSHTAGLTTSGANAYVLPYMNHALEIPLQSSKYDITDMSVPFLQMVMRGRVDYSDRPVNLHGNTRQSALDSLRTGAGFMYTLTADETLTFQKTEHTELYSTKYSVWKQDILEKAKLLGDTYKQTAKGIAEYSILADDVYKTVFKDGSWMITNYSNSEFMYGNTAVKALNYASGSEKTGG